MEKKLGTGSVIVVSVFIILGLIAVSSCIAAEFKRTKVKDLKLDGNLCYLPASPALGLGITALICLSVIQIVGTYTTVKQICSSETKSDGETDRRKIAVSLLVFSWFTFGIAVVLLSVTSSMTQRQPYGTGWLDGECYVVRDGIYIGSAFLALTTVILILGCIFFTRMMLYWRRPAETGKKVYAKEVL